MFAKPSRLLNTFTVFTECRNIRTTEQPLVAARIGGHWLSGASFASDTFGLFNRATQNLGGDAHFFSAGFVSKNSGFKSLFGTATKWNGAVST